MKFFVDAADIAEIRELSTSGLVDGVTTNPSLLAKAGRPFKEVIKEICEAVEGPVSAEVTATDFDGMIAEGERLANIAKNVAVKVPATLPPAVLRNLAKHPLTDKGLASFLTDWRRTGQEII